jgi:molybdopterin synthase sulfur carrier subunit
MPTVWIPSLLQSLTGGASQVVVPGSTVQEVIEQLDARYPGVKARLCEAGQIRPHIAVAVNGEVTPEGLRQPLEEASEVHFLPALSGGREGR